MQLSESKEVETGDWSDVMQVTTLDNQKINSLAFNEEYVSKLSNQSGTPPGNHEQIDMESSFMSQYSVTNLHSHMNKMSLGQDSFVFNKPSYIHGE